MAKETLLESDIAAGAEFIEALDKSGQPIEAALWFYYPDLSQWKLLLSSRAFEGKNLTTHYTNISKVLSSKDQISKNISIADVKILNRADPMTKLLKGIVRTDKTINTVRMISNHFNGIYVEDALIYRNT